MKRPSGRSRRTGVPIAALLVITELALGGCATGGHAASREVKIPTFTTTPPKVVVLPPATKLPEDCLDMLAQEDAEHLLNHPLPGTVRTVVDVPYLLVGRTARIACKYGVPPNGSPVPLEIGAADYIDPPTAQDRVAFTANDARSHGATVTDLAVGPDHGQVIASADGPELVLAKGKATLTIVLSPGLLPPDKVGPAFVALARQVLPYIPQ